jgi:prepilin-type N-terminal cleavage/methylation domain-containing protein
MSRTFLKSNTAGFTLVETMVAVAIISVALGGPFMAATKSYTYTMDSKNRLIASYLAQEGIEYVRLLRDNIYLDDLRNNRLELDPEGNTLSLSITAFDDFVNGASGAAASIFGCLANSSYGPTDPGGGDGSVACAVDPTLSIGIGSGQALQVCSDTSCGNKPLYLSNGQYTLTNSGTLSIFKRSVRFYDFGDNVEVVSTVTWVVRGVTRKVELVSYLSPWQ